MFPSQIKFKELSYLNSEWWVSLQPVTELVIEHNVKIKLSVASKYICIWRHLLVMKRKGLKRTRIHFLKWKKLLKEFFMDFEIYIVLHFLYPNVVKKLLVWIPLEKPK